MSSLSPWHSWPWPDAGDDAGQEDEEVEWGEDGEGEQPAVVLLGQRRHPREEDDEGEEAATRHQDRDDQEVHRDDLQQVDAVDDEQATPSTCILWLTVTEYQDPSPTYQKDADYQQWEVDEDEHCPLVLHTPPVLHAASSEHRHYFHRLRTQERKYLDKVA